jgi:crotonobetainyl-CoA:carnitine CoA-transferase CaiB-like acyl-CoA transferase
MPSLPITEGKRPLSRFRICDFGGVLAGAGATRLLAAFGAQVIRIEDPTNNGRWDVMRGTGPFKDGQTGLERGGGFNNHNVEKLGITLNLKSERGKALFRRLVEVSDVVTENFAAGVMRRLGFGYEELRGIKQDIVYVSNCGFGHSGPYQGFKSWGPIVQALSGLTFTSGLPGQPPAGWGYSYMDHSGAYYMAISVLMALVHRERSGEGQWVDLAMTEAATTLNGPALLDYTVNGCSQRSRESTLDSNRSRWPRMAPHGVFPARGDDEWVAIAVRDAADWQLFVAVVDEEWARAERFGSLAGRLENEAELEDRVGVWTALRDKFETQAVLVRAGIPAAAVQRPSERIDGDENTRRWGLWPGVDHPAIGSVRVDGLPVHHSEGDWEIRRGAPLLGQHNEEVYGGLLGLSSEEREALREEGVI